MLISLCTCHMSNKKRHWKSTMSLSPALQKTHYSLDSISRSSLLYRLNFMISNNKFAPSTNINCRQLLPLSPKHKFKDARWFLINVNVSGSVFAASQFSLHSCCNLCRSYHPSLQFAKSIVYFYFGRSLHPPEALANFLATWPDPILISPRGARKIFFFWFEGAQNHSPIFLQP